MAGSPDGFPKIVVRKDDWSVYANPAGVGPLNQTSGFTKIQISTNDTAYLFKDTPQFMNNGSSGFPQTAPAVAEDGAWHHWAMSYNASTSTLTQSLDGVVGRVLTLGGVLQPFYDATSSVQIAYGNFVNTGGATLVSNIRLVTNATLLPYAVNYTVPTSPLGAFANGTTALLLRCVTPPPPPSPSPPSPSPPSPPPFVWQYAGAFADNFATGRTLNFSATTNGFNATCVPAVAAAQLAAGAPACALPTPTSLSACEAWAVHNGFNTIGIQNGGEARALRCAAPCRCAVHAAALP